MRMNTLRRPVVALLIFVSLTGFRSFESIFAPKADLWPRWQAHDPADTSRIDYSVWQDLLDRYLMPSKSGVNLFDYGAIGDADRDRLDRLIRRLSALPIRSYSRNEQMAYWINLYNALTVQVVVSHFPVASIRDIDISPGFFSDGPWDKKLVTVEGEQLSLNDIEHRILRPIWRDPRIHYAVNCASVGCPNLNTRAYTGNDIETMLEAAARAFINDSRAARWDDGRLIVSRIYDWFYDDFGTTDQDILDHLARYAGPERARRLAAAERIDSTAYDWSLNGHDMQVVIDMRREAGP